MSSSTTLPRRKPTPTSTIVALAKSAIIGYSLIVAADKLNTHFLTLRNKYLTPGQIFYLEVLLIGIAGYVIIDRYIEPEFYDEPTPSLTR